MGKNRSVHDRLEKSSIQDWKSSLVSAREEGNLEEEAEACRALGDLYRDRGKLEMATKWHRAALELCIAMNDKILICRAYGVLGITFMKQKLWEKAIESHRHHLEIAISEADKIEEQRANCNLGDTYLNWCSEIILPENIKLCFEHLEKSLSLALFIFTTAVDRKTRDSSQLMLADANMNLAVAYDLKEDFLNAENFYKEALNIAIKIDEKETQCHIYENLSAHYSLRKDWEKSIENIHILLKLAKDIKYDHCTADALCNMGDTFFKMGEYKSALESFQSYLALIQVHWPNDCQLVEKAKYNIETVLNAIKNKEKIGKLEKQLQKCSENEKFSLYGQLGDCYSSLDMHQEALKIFESQLKYLDKNASQQDEAILYYNLGVLSESLKKHRDAVNYHKKEMTLISPNNKKEMAIVLCNLATSMDSCGENSSVVIDMYRQSLKFAKEINDIQIQINCLSNIKYVMENTNMIEGLLEISNELSTLEVAMRLDEENEDEDEKDGFSYFAGRNASKGMKSFVANYIRLKPKKKGSSLNVRKERTKNKKPRNNQITEKYNNVKAVARTKKISIVEKDDEESQEQIIEKRKAIYTIQESSDNFNEEDFEIASEPYFINENPFYESSPFSSTNLTKSFTGSEQINPQQTQSPSIEKVICKDVDSVLFELVKSSKNIDMEMKLNRGQCNSFFEYLKGRKDIEILNLSKCNISEFSSWNVGSIVSLNISSNLLNDRTISHFCSFVSNCRQLEMLDVSYNFFTEHGLCLVLNSLGNCLLLNKLSIAHCHLVDWNNFDFTNWKYIFRRLKNLDFSSQNQWNKKIIDFLLDCHNLKELNISHNNVVLLNELYFMPNLKILIAENCQLVDEGIYELIEKSAKLEQLDLSENIKLTNCLLFETALKKSFTLKEVIVKGTGFDENELENIDTLVEICI